MPACGRRSLYRVRLAAAPLPAAGFEATATATATAEALALRGAVGGPGRCGPAGDAVNPQTGPAAGGCAFGRLRSSASQSKRPHPWRLGRAILGAYAPATPHHPGLDRFMRRSGRQRQKQRRFLGSDEERTGRSRFPAEKGSDPDGRGAKRPALAPALLFLFRGWTHTETVRGRAGGLGRGVSRMDAAAKPPGTDSRRPLHCPPARPNP